MAPTLQFSQKKLPPSSAVWNVKTEDGSNDKSQFVSFSSSPPPSTTNSSNLVPSSKNFLSKIEAEEEEDDSFENFDIERLMEIEKNENEEKDASADLIVTNLYKSSPGGAQVPNYPLTSLPPTPVSASKVNSKGQAPNAQNHPTQSFQETAIIKRRTGFDEPAFRAAYQDTQAEFATRFKSLVDKLYDALDRTVSEISKAICQQQNENFRQTEEILGEIRRTTIQAGNIRNAHYISVTFALETLELSMQSFASSVQQAFMQSFANQ